MANKLSGLHKEAYKILRVNGITPAGDLADSLGVDYRQCMSLLNELALVYAVPVGSSRDKEGIHGMYIAKNKQEAYDGTAQLYSQYLKMKKRVDVVRKADFSVLKAYDEQCEII